MRNTDQTYLNLLLDIEKMTNDSNLTDILNLTIQSITDCYICPACGGNVTYLQINNRPKNCTCVKCDYSYFSDEI